MLFGCGCRAQRTWEMEAVRVVRGLEPKKEGCRMEALGAGINNEVEAIRAVKGSEPKKRGALEWSTGQCLSDIFKTYIALPKDAAWLCFETGPRLSYRLRWTCLGLASSSPHTHPSLSVLSSISSGLPTARSRVLGTGAQLRGSPSSDLLPCLY